MAASQAVKEALWQRKLTTDLRGYLKTMQMYTDNQAALTLLKNPIASARSKHIDIIPTGAVPPVRVAADPPQVPRCYPTRVCHLQGICGGRRYPPVTGPLCAGSAVYNSL